MTSANRLTAQERASVLAALTSALKHVSSLEVEGGVLAQVDAASVERPSRSS